VFSPVIYDVLIITTPPDPERQFSTCQPKTGLAINVVAATSALSLQIHTAESSAVSMPSGIRHDRRSFAHSGRVGAIAEQSARGTGADKIGCVWLCGEMSFCAGFYRILPIPTTGDNDAVSRGHHKTW
jgi:hypothetical protein